MNGEAFTLRLDTEYPFKETLRYTVEEAGKVDLELRIRKPGWCRAMALHIDRNRFAIREEGGFQCVRVQWKAGDSFTATLPMALTRSHWYRVSLAFERGPMVLVLDLDETWTLVKEVAGVKDYEVRTHSPWNYALAQDAQPELESHDVGAVPFSKAAPPIIARVPGRQLPGWAMQDNSVAPVPQSPAAAKAWRRLCG